LSKRVYFGLFCACINVLHVNGKSFRPCVAKPTQAHDALVIKVVTAIRNSRPYDFDDGRLGPGDTVCLFDGGKPGDLLGRCFFFAWVP